MSDEETKIEHLFEEKTSISIFDNVFCKTWLFLKDRATRDSRDGYFVDESIGIFMWMHPNVIKVKESYKCSVQNFGIDDIMRTVYAVHTPWNFGMKAWWLDHKQV